MLKKIISYSFRFFLNESIKNKKDFLFLSLVNIRFLFLHKELKIIRTRIENQKVYKISDSKLKITKYFMIKNQGYMSYHNGFRKRGINMGETRYLLKHIKFEANDIVFDIGANLGDLTLYFDFLNTSIKYYGFEPGKYEFLCLKKNILNKKQHKIFNYALGNTDGDTTFYYKPFNGDSSIVNINDYDEKYDVKIKKLDSFFEEQKLEKTKIKLIKLEAEGFEPEIIEGLKNHLKNVEYISADLGFERGIEQDTTAPKIINYLLKNHFQLIDCGKNNHTFLFMNQLFKDQ